MYYLCTTNEYSNYDYSLVGYYYRQGMIRRPEIISKYRRHNGLIVKFPDKLISRLHGEVT